MKYPLPTIASAIYISIASILPTFGATCDYSETDTVRYGNVYTWTDRISNPSAQTLSIQNVNVGIGYGANMISGLSGPEVLYWDIGPWATNVLFARTLQSSRITNHPSTRSTGGDFSLEWTTTYNYNNAGPTSNHVECANYIITWCGDGIKDQNDGEACDGTDGITPGVYTCNDVCQLVPVEVTPPPVCGSTNNSNNTQLNQNSPNLCPSGSSVTGFQANGTNPVNYSWTCSNTAGSSPTCNASYTPPPPPVDGVCDSSVSGPQSSPLSNGSCTVGSVVPGSFQAIGTNPINYSWKCSGSNGGSDSPACTASYTPPVNPNPTCDSLTATPRSGTSPVTSTLSCATTDATTVSISCGNGQGISGANGTCIYTNTTGAPVVYAPRCTVDGTITNSGCTTSISVDPVPTNNTFDLSLKKYIDTVDAVGDAQTAPGVAKNTGNAFTYIIRVKNEGPASTSNTTTVTDTFPLGVNPNGNISAPGWSCNGAPVVSTITCTRSDVLAPGQTYPNISVPVVVTATTGTVTNIAKVSNPDEDPTDNYHNNNTDPAVFNVPWKFFDLQIKKYIGNVQTGFDAQTASTGPTKNTNDTFEYNIYVKNKGPSSTTGTTTVRDILPAGVEFSGATTWTNGSWSCTYTSASRRVNCDSTLVVQSQSLYETIIVPVKVTASTGAITNRAVVYNPYETPNGFCLMNYAMPVGNEALCLDMDNTDPAVFTLPTTGFDLRLKKYIGTTDAQPNNPVLGLKTGDPLSYFIYVVNAGPAANTGTTTVKDILPAGVEYSGSVNGNNFWSCATLGRTLTCTSTGALPIGGFSPAIQVPVRITASTGSVTNISSVDNPNEINRCNADGTMPATDSASCTKDPLNSDPAVFILTPPIDGFDLGVKKYVGDNDAQPGNAVPKNLGDLFNYVIRVKNEGPAQTKGDTTITDILPFGITSISTPTGTGWTCSVAQKKCVPGDLICLNSGTPFTCSYTGIISAGQYYPDVVVPSQVSATGTITNRAFVYNANELNPCLKDGSLPTGNESDCTRDTKNSDPAVIVVGTGVSTGSGFDLFLKKYIGSDDAQTSPGGKRNTNDTFSYNIVVTNKGPQSTTGVTTVQDILPSGVVYNSTATGWTNGGWNCTYTSTGTVVRCTSSDIVASGASYSGTILIPVKVTAGANTTVANIAAVDNPNEIGRCNTDGTLPATATATCTRDTTNSDPAYFNVPGGSSGGGNTYYIPTCVNGINSCSSQVHSSLAGCNSFNTGSTCYSFITECNRANTLSCGGGPGGPSCTNPAGCVPYTSGRCGDGIIQPAGTDGITGTTDDEECDFGTVGTSNSCSSECKVQITTNPGANPIKRITISIPGFTNILGSSRLVTNSFSGNNIIVGHDSNVFTLADTVNLDINTQLGGALLVPADREFCLKSTSGSLAPKTLCQSISKFNTPISLNGAQYVVINGGYVQERLADGTYQSVPVYGPTGGSVMLLKGSDTTAKVYGGISTTASSARLRDEFLGVGPIGGLPSSIILFNKNPVTEPTAAIDLAQFQVKISGVMVGGTSSTVNRSISHYFTPNSQLADILAQYSSRVTTTSATTNSINSTSTPNINISSTISNGNVITNVSDLARYTLNGNTNIFSAKGPLTIASCPNNTFLLDGVRTLLVEGDLTIRCNIGYGSNDTTSSWAFVVKKGNIVVDKSVTNLAGVYVAIPDGVSGAGEFRSVNNETTTNILRLDGSMYGNANPLFQSRLYVRGTNAYDILTTGVILSYSNRALVNPPPLLSNFLNNYSVSRVVR